MLCFGAVMNNIVSIRVQIFLWAYTFISLGKIQRSGIAGSYGNMLHIEELPNFFSKVTLFYNSHMEFKFSSSHTKKSNKQQVKLILIMLYLT